MEFEFMDIISAITDGEATPEQEARLREYLESDEQCRRVYAAFTGISEALREDMVAPPPELLTGVMEKIGGQKSPARKKNVVHLWGTLAAAACFALIVFGASQLGLFGAGKSAPKNDMSLGNSVAAPSVGSDASYRLTDGDSIEVSDEIPSEPPALIETGKPAHADTPLFAEQVELLNKAFSSNAQFIQKEQERLLTARVITLYEGKYDAEDTEAKDALPLVPVFSEDETKRLFELMTADILLSYDEDAAGELEVYCTILFTDAESEDGQTRENLTVTVWIYDDLLYFKINSEPQILYLSDTFPIDFEDFIRQLTLA